MAQNKIQPWHYAGQDQVSDYARKLTTLSNFNSSSTLKNIKLKSNIQEQITKMRQDRIFTNQSANATLKFFNKTNRSEYLRRITKLVFDQDSNKKYKFEPELAQAKRRLKTLKPRKIRQIVKQQQDNTKLEIKKSPKQIYYNLTQISSLSKKNNIKCYTEQNKQQQKSPKTKLLNKIISTKSNLKLPVFRELSVQRKIFIIQSGIKSSKDIKKQGIFQAKKNSKKQKNIIEQICRVERQYAKQRNNIIQNKL